MFTHLYLRCIYTDVSDFGLFQPLPKQRSEEPEEAGGEEGRAKPYL